jgi:AcrR family transcriptional regulator
VAKNGGAATRRAGRRKTEVLDAACRVISERGAEATRFVDVAEASGVPVSTLQYYFGNREDLVVAAFRHASHAELATIRAGLLEITDPWARLRYVLEEALAGFASPSPHDGRMWIESWRFAIRDDGMRADVHEDYAAWREIIVGIVRGGVASGHFTAALPLEQTAAATIALLDGLGIPLEVGDPAVPHEVALGTALAVLGCLLAPK